MTPTRGEYSAKADLWRDYRRAFACFSQTVRRVQALTAQPDPDRAALDAALLEMEKARVTYNSRRDALAESLLPGPDREALPAVTPDSPSAYAERVKVIAELLWEGAGRPDGTADDDWYHAEEIVRRAATA